ncbi:MAG: sulfatase [Candidatus Helarchaeota archaeon]
MNVILILLDSLNKSYIEPYGNKRVRTPNLMKLAKKGVVFDNHFLGSAPCMPAKRELFSGRKNEFLWKFWGAVEPFDRLLPVEAKVQGAATALITDHYHYWEMGTGIYGYHENYMYTDLIRGHELDMASSEPLEDPDDYPSWVKAYLKWRSSMHIKYYRNVKHFKKEVDFHGPKVIQSACDWLDRNHGHEKFFLHIESFDPHEPWYIPEPYRSMYGEYNENYTCWPPYQNARMFKKFISEASEEELEFIRNQYRGKVTMVDNWLGRIWEKLEQYDLWSNTCVIVVTDHGHALAEPEKKIKQYGKSHPIFEDVANIPLIIYHPEIKGGQRVQSTFSTIVDIRATILDILSGGKIEEKAYVDGKSLMPVLKGEVSSIREYILYGTYGAGVSLTTWDTTYIRGFDPRKPLYIYTCSYPMLLSPGSISGFGEYFGVNLDYEGAVKFLTSITAKMESGYYIPGVKIPQWKIPMISFMFSAGKSTKECKRSYLFDRKKDLNFQNNLAGKPEYAELENEMMQKMKIVLKEEGCPPEQFKRFMLE